MDSRFRFSQQKKTGFKPNSQAEEQRKALYLKRKQESEDLYVVGCECLGLLEKIAFNHTQLAQQASRFFILAARKNRRDPRPLTKLAYLIFVFGNRTKAMLYLKEALRLDPTHNEALRLKEKIKTYNPQAAAEQLRKIQAEEERRAAEEKAKQAFFAAEVSFFQSTEQEDDDFDPETVYKEVNQLTRQLMAELKKIPLDLKPTLVKENLVFQQKMVQKFNTLRAEIQSQILRLKGKKDISSLRPLIDKVDANLEPIREVVGVSSDFLKITETLTARIDDCKALVKALRLVKTSDKLQELQTQLDAIAHEYERHEKRIREIELKGYNTRKLERYAKPLNMMISQVQDLLNAKRP